MIRIKLCKHVMLLFLLLFMGKNFYAQNNSSTQTNDQILKCLYDADQKIRLTFDSLQTAKASKEELMLILGEMGRVDFENQRIAFPILNTYLTGEINLLDESLNALYYIVQHADGEAQMKYQGFIKILFDKQIISNTEYGWFIDRLNVRQKKAQPFGFQSYTNAYTMDTFLYPISSETDELRAKIGMENPDYGESFSGEYAPIYMSSSEYVIFGHALCETQGDGVWKGIVAEVSVGEIKVLTNDIGFYAIKLNRNDVPKNINFIIEGKLYSQCIHNVPEANWEIIDLFIMQ